ELVLLLADCGNRGHLGLTDCRTIFCGRRQRRGKVAIPDVIQKLTEPPCHVLGSDTPVDGLQEVQLVNRFLRLLIWLPYAVLGFAAVAHWTSSFLGSGVVTVDLTLCWAGRWSGSFLGARGAISGCSLRVSLPFFRCWRTFSALLPSSLAIS